MKVLLINSVCGIRSTGRICTDLAKEFEKQGHEVKIAYGRESVPEQYKKYAIRIGNNFGNVISALHTRITDKHGFANKRATAIFLKWAEMYQPDLLWLHNIHGYFINIEMLFDWIKSHPNMEVKWTLHDCWPFTGHCTHFSVVKCENWKSQCHECKQSDCYPSSFVIDNSRDNFIRKKRAFTGVSNMTLITPSNWLANLVSQSFLNKYPIEIVYNTVDTNVFKSTPSNFREKLGLCDKTIILGVASVWNEKKGLMDFLKLADVLDDRYKIVLVGLSSKQLKKLPTNIIGLPRTNNPKELAAIYTAADIFVNPSQEETFGLTTIEARSCNTPVIVYKGTACEEIVREFGGYSVEQSPIAILKCINELNI